MQHLESSFTGKNSLWRYVLMFAAVLIASNTIGGIPLIVAMALRSASDPDILGKISANPNDIGALGLNPDFGFFAMLFPFIIGLLTFSLLVRPLNGRTLRVTINGTSSFRWNRFIISAFIYGILSALYLFVYLKADPSNFRINNTSSTIIPLILISFSFIPFQAAFEEVLFRGYLMQGFSVLMRNRWMPLVLTAFLFGLMHSFNPEVEEFGFFSMMPQYVLFGLIFGVITILDDGIEAAIGAHAANNIFLCIMVTNRASALQTQAVYEQINIYPWIEFGGLLISGVIFLLILKKVFKWGSFSRLFSKVGPIGNDDQIPYTDVLSSVR
jgi:membrane protease YdiL (CAAX protease family)